MKGDSVIDPMQGRDGLVRQPYESCPLIFRIGGSLRPTLVHEFPDETGGERRADIEPFRKLAYPELRVRAAVYLDHRLMLQRVDSLRAGLFLRDAENPPQDMAGFRDVPEIGVPIRLFALLGFLLARHRTDLSSGKPIIADFRRAI